MGIHAKVPFDVDPHTLSVTSFISLENIEGFGGEHQTTQVLAQAIEESLSDAGYSFRRAPLFRAERIELEFDGVRALIIVLPTAHTPCGTRWQASFLTSPRYALMTTAQQRAAEALRDQVASSLASTVSQVVKGYPN